MAELNTGSAFDRQLARIAVGAYDDAQEMRQATMNRIRDVVRKRREDIPFDVVEEKVPDEERDYDPVYEDDNLPDLIAEMREEGVLDDEELGYLQRLLGALAAVQSVENEYREVMRITEAEPIYHEWLTNVYGVSTTLTARLIHKYGYAGPVTVVDTETDEVIFDETRDGFDGAVDAVRRATAANHEAFEDDDVEHAPYRVTGSPRVSDIWSYSGLAPGQGRTKGERSWYDPEAKTLMWNVADCIIKQGDRSLYREHFYDPYKQKQLDRMAAVDGVDYEVRDVEQNGQTIKATFDAETGDRLFNGSPPNSQGHADLRSRRYLSKKFLKHYWYIARDLQGLETPDEWVITHGGHGKREDTFENPAYAKKALEQRANSA